MKIGAIDYSITSPSICIFDTGLPYTFENCKFFNLNTNKKTFGYPLPNIFIQNHIPYATTEERFFNIGSWVALWCRLYNIEKAYIEDYSMGSKGKVFHIAENTAVLKNLLWRRNVPIVPVAPTVIKKSFTGKGNAKKEQMEEEFKKRTCLDLRTVLKLTAKQENPISDIIDSFALGEIAYDDNKDN